MKNEYDNYFLSNRQDPSRIRIDLPIEKARKIAKTLGEIRAVSFPDDSKEAMLFVISFLRQFR